MLQITVKLNELYDPIKEEFIYFDNNEVVLNLEHSLLSLSRWESKWHKPYMTKDPKTNEEILDYVRCMTLNKSIDDNVYRCLSETNVLQIKKYIEDPMTATTFQTSNDINREVITAEVVYYWMISLGIPFECQKWHLNKLLTLIKVCSVKNTPQKKMSKSELANRNRALNSQRLKQLNTKG